MQEGGDLYKLKMKWWKQKRGGGQCLKSKTSSATSLGYDNVSGIFLVTFSGLVQPYSQEGGAMPADVDGEISLVVAPAVRQAAQCRTQINSSMSHRHVISIKSS